jgi:uncharacterized membrane protein YgcG
MCPPAVAPEEMDPKRREEEAATKVTIGGGSGGITKSEMMSEMRIMIQELMGLGLIGAKANTNPSELKLELVPNDVKLEGIKNYLSWSRRVCVLLGGKVVEHYLEETCVEPVDKLGTEWRTWHTTNSMIVAWLLASMSPTVSKRVEAMRTASQIWQTLSSIYSWRGNVVVMMEIQNKADVVKQAGRPVKQYASELQYLWGELDHYAPLQMVCPHDAHIVHKWVEDRRVTHFLKNMDPEFESRRAAFCHQESLPTMDEAVSAMIDEESRLRVMGNDNHVKPVYAAIEDRECYNCGEKGHLSYNCPNPRGNGGRGGSRGGRWGTRVSYGRGHGSRGGGRGHGGSRANIATTEESPSVTLTGEQVKQWEQWQKGKSSECLTVPVEQSTNNFGNFSNYAHMGEGTQAQVFASSCRHRIDWVIDLGASKHVTGMSTSFKTYTPCTHSESVQIADGTSQQIHGIGSIECTPSLSLSLVLHVPSFPVNLLSVSSIIDQSKCTVTLMKPLVSFKRGGLRERLGLESGIMGCGSLVMRNQL